MPMAIAALCCRTGAGELEYHASFDAAVEAAEKNRQLVMIVVVAAVTDKGGRDICKLFREETLAEEQMARFIRRHFAPYLLDITAVNQRKQALPTVVQGCFKAGEQISVPMVIFLDAKCKEVNRVVGYAPPQGYIAHLRKVAEQALGLIPEKERRDAQRAFQRGKQAFEDKDYAAATDALKEAVAAGVPNDDTETAKRLLGEIEAKAAEALQAASDLEGKEKLGSAIRGYRECARGFKGTEAGTKAAARLVELRKDPDIRKRLNNYMAAKLLATAQEDIQQRKFQAAMESLDTVLKRYPDAESAVEAKKLRERVEGDPEAASRLRDAKAKPEAERLLSLGDSFRRNKMHEKALAEYEKVVAKFPDTSYARTAQARIAEVKKELGQ